MYEDILTLRAVLTNRRNLKLDAKVLELRPMSTS